MSRHGAFRGRKAAADDRSRHSARRTDPHSRRTDIHAPPSWVPLLPDLIFHPRSFVNDGLLRPAFGFEYFFCEMVDDRLFASPARLIIRAHDWHLSRVARWISCVQRSGEPDHSPQGASARYAPWMPVLAVRKLNEFAPNTRQAHVPLRTTLRSLLSGRFTSDPGTRYSDNPSERISYFQEMAAKAARPRPR